MWNLRWSCSQWYVRFSTMNNKTCCCCWKRLSRWHVVGKAAKTRWTDFTFCSRYREMSCTSTLVCRSRDACAWTNIYKVHLETAVTSLAAPCSTDQPQQRRTHSHLYNLLAYACFGIPYRCVCLDLESCTTHSLMSLWAIWLERVLILYEQLPRTMFRCPSKLSRLVCKAQASESASFCATKCYVRRITCAVDYLRQRIA